jgi:hypothetical protein
METFAQTDPQVLTDDFTEDVVRKILAEDFAYIIIYEELSADFVKEVVCDLNVVGAGIESLSNSFILPKGSSLTASLDTV